MSIDIQRVTDDDRRWLEDHPQATFYYRLVTWGEGAQLVLVDDRARRFPAKIRLAVVGRVRVVQFRPGYRGRAFEGVRFVTEGN